MRNHKRVRFLASALFSLTLGANALAADPVPVPGGTLVYGVANDTNTYDCHRGSSFSVLHHLAPHYSLLLKVDPKNYPKIIGDLAENWSLSPDNLTYTFKLRPNVHFHDGTTLTAEDVRVSYERLRNPPPGVISVRQVLFQDIESIETPDELTVIFKLSRVNSSMTTNFASPWNCIYSAARLKDDAKFPETNVMGTGPFVFVENVAGSHWVGKRFDNYFRSGRPYLDGFKAITMSSTALVNGLAGGQIDAEFRGISPADMPRIEASQGDKVQFHSIAGMSSFYVTFNTEKKPFDDIRVRTALSLAIDRWGGIEPLSRISYLKHVSGFQRPGAETALSEEELSKLPGFGRDIKAARAEARRLLAEAGVPALKFKLINRGPAMPYSPFALYLIDQWRQVGVTVEHVLVDTPAWLQRRSSGNFEVIVDSSGDWTDDPSIVLARFLSADKTQNTSRAIDRTFDDLYERQLRTTDEKERKSLVKQMESRIIAQAYSVPVFRGQRLVALSSKIMGFDLVPTHMTPGNLEDLWLRKD